MLFTVAAAATPLPATASINPRTTSQTIDLSTYFTGAAMPANTYAFDTTLGLIPVQLTPGVTPLTVANFLSYLNAGAYNNTVIHRADSGFVWQTGEYKFTSGSTDTSGFTTTPVNAGVQNEFSQSNVVGTIALAKLSGNENSGTDGFFFNLADNSSNLDSQNGGFTVFGNVLGSAGLAVMQSIGNESVLNEGGDFDTLPVLNSAATVPVVASNLLYINSIDPVATSYEAFSDNPGLVTASVSGSTLSLSPVDPNQKATGTANITVDAFDADGNVVTQTFTVSDQVPTVTEAIGTGSGVNTFVYTNSNKVATKVSLSAGAAVLTLEGYNLAVTKKGATETLTSDDGAALDDLTVVATDPHGHSVLTLNAGKGGTSVGEINSSTSSVNAQVLRSLNAPNVTLTGNSTYFSSIGTVNLASIALGAVFNTYAVGKLNVSGAVAGEIEAGTYLQQVTLKTSFTGSLQAVRVGKLSTRDMSATVNLSSGIGILSVVGTFSGLLSAEFVDRATITKLSGATIELTGSSLDIGTFKTQTLASSALVAAGSLGTIMIAQPISASEILAGVDFSSATTPTAAEVAGGNDTAEIVSLKIGGSKTANSFADSEIGAAELRSVSIGNIVDATSTAAFYGIAAQEILSLKTRVGSQPLNLVDVASEGILQTRLAAQKIALTNLMLEIVAPGTGN